ncbi:hypothetical protein [Streptomyces orinoci]|uniref:Uncharacterized protein n=1 Tax=Streptomyces orinoci TaxID=67339 RepID=A0ABV3JS64_STRON|nr:hypothetical protein [Streptomyces orinoci]
MPLPVAMMAKQAPGRAFEATLLDGARSQHWPLRAVLAAAGRRRLPEFRHR